MPNSADLHERLDDLDAPPEMQAMFSKFAFSVDSMSIDIGTTMTQANVTAIKSQLNTDKAPSEAKAYLDKIKSELTT